MDGRLRIDVVKGEHFVILIDNFRRNLARGDLLENRHRIEQFNSANNGPPEIFSRMKQVTSSRSASQARDQVLEPRSCLIAGCSPKKCIPVAPVSRIAATRFSSKSKNASS